MAVIPVIGDILKVVIACRHGVAQQIGESRLFLRVYQNPPAALSLEEAGEAIAGHFQAPYISWLASNCKYNGVSIQRVSPGVRTATYYALRDIAGIASSSGTMATQASGLVRFPTGEGEAVPPSLPLPPTKGRAYVPFVPKTFFDGAENSLSNNGKAALDTIAQKMGPRVFLSPGGFAWDLIVYQEASRIVRFATSTAASWYTATQRRRGAFGQLNKPFGGG